MVFVVRHSELKDFAQCPLKHRFAWVEGYRSPDSEASSLGTAWHLVMANHYRAIKQLQDEAGECAWLDMGMQIEENHGQISKFIRARFEGEMRDTLTWMYDGYVEKWGLDPHWRVLSVEQTLIVPFVEPTGHRSRYRYQWTTDLLVQDMELAGEPLVVIDHKSTKNPIGRVDIDLDDQYGNYTWAWRRSGKPVLMQVCNQAKTAKLKRPMTLQERFSRTPGYRTDRELIEIEQDSLAKAKASRTKANRERPYSAVDPRVCGWKCDYTEVHLALRKGAVGWNQLPLLMKMHGLEERDAPSGAGND